MKDPTQRELDFYRKLEKAYEARSKEIEKRTGFKRSVKVAQCPECKENRPVFMDEIFSAEGGYLQYNPPRIVERGFACVKCQAISGYEKVHQSGTLQSGRS